MKIEIESTDTLTTYNGGKVREWNGTTERGIPCTVYVAGVRVHREQDCSQFEQELKEAKPPLEAVAQAAYDLRQIL